LFWYKLHCFFALACEQAHVGARCEREIQRRGRETRKCACSDLCHFFHFLGTSSPDSFPPDRLLFTTRARDSMVSLLAGYFCVKEVVLMLPSLHLKAFNTVLNMCRNLISDPTEQFSKLIFVRKILLHRPWEEKSITPILKNVLVIYERFKRHISCFELNTVANTMSSRGDFGNG